MTNGYRALRGDLAATRAAVARGRLTVGFLGGSITDPMGRNRWSQYLCDWLAHRYPKVSLCVENAAISATGSLSGLLRLERCILKKKCDLVFVEYAVNDDEADREARMHSREGLLRRLRSNGCDVICAYTFCQSMLDDMLDNRLPPSVADFERLARHYGVSGVFMGKYALDQVRAGLLRWEEWLPDGLHPENCGSRVYAEAAISLLEEALRGPEKESAPLPAPLDTQYYKNARELDLAALPFSWPWQYRNRPGLLGFDSALYTGALGAVLEFDFTGTGFALSCNFGYNTCDFEYALDGGAWRRYRFTRYDWMAAEGWPRTELIAGNLDAGRHAARLRTVMDGASKGSIFEICGIGIL